MRGVVFREWVPAGYLAKAIVAFTLLGVLCILSITIVTGFVFQSPLWIFVSAFVIAFLLLLFWNYRGIQIQMSKEGLSVNYGVFNRKSIALNEIVSCEATKASFRRYGGVGVRLGLDGSWAYTTSFGDAVKIRRKKGRLFVFSTSDPEKICKIITHMKKAQASQILR